jgi:hypothetical protein
MVTMFSSLRWWECCNEGVEGNMASFLQMSVTAVKDCLLGTVLPGSALKFCNSTYCVSLAETTECITKYAINKTI